MSVSPDRAEPRGAAAPAEGWISVILVTVLGLILATAMDEPAWVNGRGGLTDCLAWGALGGTLAGVVGAKVGWGRWTAHAVGALFAGFLLPVIAGWAVMPGMTAVQAFRFTASGTVQAYLDLTVRGLPFTTQEVHYVLVLAGLVWATMQYAAFAVFRHRRPLAAVVVVGLVLLANMALTKRDQLGWLILYSGVSLFLLIQMHAFGERASWTRRRIGDPGSISLLYLRTGTVFVVSALVVAVVLTQYAASSPLAPVWSGVRTRLVQIGKEIGPFLPVGGDVRGGSGVAFGSSATISTQWFSDSGVAFTATVPFSARGLKFRAATYDTFAVGGWIQSETRQADVPAGSSLLAGSPEVPSAAKVETVKALIVPDGYHDTALLSLGLADTVDQPTTLSLSGLQGWFAGASIAADTPYTVTGLVPRLGGEGGITQNQLRAATTAYPADVVAQYTAVPPGAMGPSAQQLLQTVIAKSPSLNPYDLASTIESFLRSPYFQYSTDVRNLNCDSRSVVECFARYRIGYCQYYASEMAILLRAANPANPIPTRYVQGFLPSEVIGGQEVIHNYQAHAWVEVFFPGFGWIAFDPTGGGIGRPAELPAGPPVESAAPLASGDIGSGAPRPTRRDFEPGGGPTGSVPPRARTQPGDLGFVIVLGMLVAGLVGALAATAWRRGVWPGDASLQRYISLRAARGEVIPDAAWTTVSRSASWFGFGQRPTETIYEYATSLAEVVPVARVDISTIAEAKVETMYARAELDSAREHAVAAAVRRLRLSLVRLLFARGRRRRRS